MPTTSVTSKSRFPAELQKAIANDGHIDKQEGRKLRQRALDDLKVAPNRAKVATDYSDKFDKLAAKASDKKAATYLNTVGEEFKSRATYQKAATALQKYLVANKSSLDKNLKNIDVADKANWEVGTSMNRGVWLRVPLKDQSLCYESCDAAAKLFTKVPALKKFGEIYVIA